MGARATILPGRLVRRCSVYWKATSAKLRSLRLCRLVHAAARSISMRADADAQVLVHALAVEVVGHAGQLDLAVQRLVAHAQQGAVGHAEAKAVGGDGGAFHVQRHGAVWLKRRWGWLSGSSSQLRLSVLATVPVRMMRLSSAASSAGDVGHRRSSAADFGQRGIGTTAAVLRRARGLRAHSRGPARSRPVAGCCAGPAQWPSMIQACGRSTAMWSVMVLALAGPTPMLTMVMPLRSARAHQVVGGHLRQARRGLPSSSPASAGSPRARHHVAGFDEGDVFAAVAISWPRRTNSSM